MANVKPFNYVTSFVDVKCDESTYWVSGKYFMVARHKTIATFLSESKIPDYVYIHVFKANGVFLFQRKLENNTHITLEKNDYLGIAMWSGHDAMPLYSLKVWII